MGNHQLIFNYDGEDWVVDGRRAKDHKLSFPERSGSHKITFLIGTPTGRFEFDTRNPIWVQEGTTCPTSPSSHPDLRIDRCDATRLVVRNANEATATLCYQLNVFETESLERMPIDPILANGGHG